MKHSIHEEELLEELSQLPDIISCIDTMCAFFEVDYITYHLAYHEGKAIDTPYVKTNYPPIWVRQYLVMNYIETDPVAQAGFNRSLPCLWSDLDWSNPEIVPFAEDAAKHGIGGAGYLIPVTDRFRRRAIVNVTEDLVPKKWAKKIARNAFILQDCAEVLHRKAVIDLYGEEDEQLPLSPRELECLMWVARGKDAKSIGTILNISSHTVRDYCKSAKYKLGCASLSQAIHHATMHRLIELDN